MDNRRIRVLLADDHLVVRMGLAAIIDLEADMSVIGEASNGDEAVRLAAELRPDVVIMDLMMPKLNGADASAKILRANPDAKILVLTTFGTSDELKNALVGGVLGALVKDSAHLELIAAIRATAAGHRHVSPVIERQIRSAPKRIELTERHVEILGYVAKGFSNADIANMIGIGRDCVKAHLKTAFARLNASSRSEAVAIAIREGLLKT